MNDEMKTKMYDNEGIEPDRLSVEKPVQEDIMMGTTESVDAFPLPQMATEERSVKDKKQNRDSKNKDLKAIKSKEISKGKETMDVKGIDKTQTSNIVSKKSEAKVQGKGNTAEEIKAKKTKVKKEDKAVSEDKTITEDKTVSEDKAVKEFKASRKKMNAEKVGVEGEDTSQVDNKDSKKRNKKNKALKYTLCKLVKRDYLKGNFKDYKEIVSEPEFICRKCGRLANNKKSLCAPLPLKKSDEGSK